VTAPGYYSPARCRRMFELAVARGVRSARAWAALGDRLRAAADRQSGGLSRALADRARDCHRRGGLL